LLTIRFDQLGVRPGDLVLDAGAGFGRHAFALAGRGANVVALDYATDEVAATRATFAAMAESGEIAEERFVGGLQGDATRLPFVDGTFDRVITSEVLEHIQADTDAITEFVRVLKPGGTFAATVPTWLPEKINWMLSDEYHAPKSVGGHVRIYSATELKAKLRSAGLAITGSHHAHALHTPYWWLKCAVGVRRDDNRLVQSYKRMLEWEITKQPRGLKAVERAASPVLGKSYIVYAQKANAQKKGDGYAAVA
jgi:SAM-dependent methyltransferase